jgi:hypothetical protein
LVTPGTIKQIVHIFLTTKPRRKSPGACFCLSSLFTEIEQKNFISLL